MKQPCFVLMLCVVVCRCEKPSTHQQLRPPDQDTGAAIETLIEQLAISGEPAGDAPIYTPSREPPRSDKRVVAYSNGNSRTSSFLDRIDGILRLSAME